MLDSADSVNEIVQGRGNATGMVMDTSNSDEARALVGLALQTYGRLDVLVNNAALDRLEGHIWDLPDDEWQRTIDVNLSGVFYCSRAALKAMMETGKGCIVNISSHAAPLWEAETVRQHTTPAKAACWG